MQAAVDFTARCIAAQGMQLSAQISSSLNGVKFVQLTDEEYKALETKDPLTFYIVTKGNTVILYLGTTTIGSGVAGGNTIIQTISSLAITGNLEEV